MAQGFKGVLELFGWIRKPPFVPSTVVVFSFQSIVQKDFIFMSAMENNFTFESEVNNSFNFISQVD